MMKAHFMNDLKADLIGDDKIWELLEPLAYYSAILGKLIIVPKGFQTDLASVPRVPILYTIWGGRAHREGVLHDYLYRIDSDPATSFDQANAIFMEAMASRGKSWFVRYPMWWGVCMARAAYHKRMAKEKLV
jgi:hypothetical protein